MAPRAAVRPLDDLAGQRLDVGGRERVELDGDGDRRRALGGGRGGLSRRQDRPGRQPGGEAPGRSREPESTSPGHVGAT
jgi:hypothetical protein